jgi:hypothetical protein
VPYYLNVNIDGLIVAASRGDGYSINLKWATAYPTNRSNKILYNIYMSDNFISPFPDKFFNQVPSFISFDGSTTVDIVDLVPGTLYHFAVRAAEYNIATLNPLSLPPAYNGLVVLPFSLLQNNIGLSDLLVPLIDGSGFPSTGTIKLGAELIQYSGISGNDLVVSQRGFDSTIPSIHNTDGYDGYTFWDPNAIYWATDSEEQNTRVFECWNRFDIDHYSFSVIDGYRQKTKDILTTDLSCSDAINGGTGTGSNNTGFPAFDFAGYHRTDPVLILSGACVGSYIGGYQFCADGYNGVGLQIRGISVQDANLQRQEVLLSTTGEPVCLVRRRWMGITCRCMLPYNEYPENRCRYCFGTGIVVGWNQYFNPRRSDGRIMVRFDPTVDDLVSTDSGLESTMSPTCWTLAVPTIKDRDFIVRFDECGNEEFRYEILNVTRQLLFLDQTAAQKFAAQRIRKTDPIYQIPITYDTSLFPSTIMTSISSSLGIPLHQHIIVISEKITSTSQINQLTGTIAGHNHAILEGNLETVLGHSHTIML